MFFVAELSANHNGSLSRALEIIDAMAGKADAIKFQTWSPDTMCVDYKIKTGHWSGRDMKDLYREAHTPWEWHPQLFKRARRRKLIPFSSPFDKESVDFLETLECPIYKIASLELVDLELIEYTAKTGKPMIMSTGAASTNEIRAAVKTARQYCKDLTLLHCVSEYPTDYKNVNLKTMSALKRFGCAIGISDHSHGSIVPITATALGSQVIEKHVTISKTGLDASFSMLPSEYASMVRQCQDVETIMGRIKFNGESELRRALFWNQDLKKGTVVKREHMKTARPNIGVSPIKIDRIIGRKLKRGVKTNEPVQDTGLLLSSPD